MEQHFLHSSYREKLIEHLFVGELLKHAWLERNCSLEVSSPEVDNRGYDLIAEENGIIRHIQLKASHIGARAAGQKVHTALAAKSSGCVVWIYFDQETLQLGPFLFYGGAPGDPLPDVTSLPVAKHTKANAEGIKAERPAIRNVRKGLFTKYETYKEIYEVLFGAP